MRPAHRQNGTVACDTHRRAVSGGACRVRYASRIKRGFAGSVQTRRGKLGRVCAPIACLLLSGCFSLGHLKLEEDQLGYSRAVAESERQQTLLNVVRLRYGEAPTFLDVTQVIAGYQLQRNISGGFNVFPNAAPGTYLTGTASAQLQESPTFTFQPVTGDHYAQNFLRPLSPAELLPLVQGGLPVDVLFRLSVQSIGPLRNSTGLEAHAGEGSGDIFLLLHELRQLQIGGILVIHLQNKAPPADKKMSADVGNVYVTLAPTDDPALAGSEDTVRRLLGLSPSATKVEVVYGRFAAKGQIGLLTRPILGVLGQLAFQVEVPPEDVAAGRTQESVPTVAAENRPVVVIHAAHSKPAQAFAAVTYGERWFWIDGRDFDSKLAFSIVTILLSLAETSSGPGTVITIPAG